MTADDLIKRDKRGYRDRRAYQELRRANAVANLLCSRCGKKPLVVGTTHCQDCLDACKARREKAKAGKAAGICQMCPRPTRPGKVICQECADKQKKRREGRISAGVCIDCGGEVVPGKKFCHPHYQTHRRCDKRQRESLRIEVLRAYGGARCVCCGETILEFLQIDHIHGDGRRHREMRGAAGLYVWLKANGFPPGFQVLCANCNLAKSQRGECPHQRIRREGRVF